MILATREELDQEREITMNTERKSPGAKILIVDDEPDVVTYLETLLQDAGYQTVSAQNGREAMEVTRQESPDLVSLDITMPEESGIRYYRNLKDDPDLKDIPVVIVTAVTGYGGDSKVFERFLKSRRQIPEPEGFVAKPIDPPSFLALIAEVLSRSDEPASVH